MTELTGIVKKRLIAQGTKSEHHGVVLCTDKDEWRVRRKGGNAFKDPLLDSLVGQRIRGTGILTETTFIIEGWEVLDHPQ